jgi:putative transposase
LIDAIRTYVNFYNYFRYHESLDNVTPADVYYGRKEKVLERRKKAKRNTMQQRPLLYEKSKLAS